MMSCVIFGAGKIARGFIGHLLYLGGIPFTFIEKSAALADLVNETGRYTVHILGNSEKDCVVTGARAIGYSDKQGIIRAIAEADVVFTAVGGKNLGEIVPFLAEGIIIKAADGARLNIITCENWKQPASFLQNAVLAILPASMLEYFKTCVGFSEAVVMRSAIEPDASLLRQDPLCVNVSNYWELPVDASRLAGPLPDIPGVKAIEGFAGFLERKFYTYNSANGTVSYLGALLGYKMIADAAQDERILEILDKVYSETSKALSKKHHFPLEQQAAFARTSFAKLQDKAIVDFIERNARDPLRKLGPDDRLVGSAQLVLEYGIEPLGLATAIAAAIHYENPGDPSAEELRQLLKVHGTGHILENICGLEKDGTIYNLVLKKEKELKDLQWIK